MLRFRFWTTIVILTALLSFTIPGSLLAQDETDEPDPTPTIRVQTPSQISEISGTVIIPDPGAETTGLIRFGAIDGNLVMNGLFAVAIMALAALFMLSWRSIEGNRQNVSPDGVRQIQEATFRGAYQIWTQLGHDVQQTPTPADDALYYLANVPVSAIKEHMEGLGFKVTNEETDTAAAEGTESSGSSPFVG